MSEDESEQNEEEMPLSSLRERVEKHQAESASDAEESPLPELGEEATTTNAERSELFEEVEVGDIDSEQVWDAVVEGTLEPGELLGEEPQASPDNPEAEPAAAPTETPDEDVINKRKYCQRCEFFAEPPGVACENTGTDIIELVDSDHFRVRNCPKVTDDDEALGGLSQK